MNENKILKWAVILSIVIVANLFFNYALSLTLNSPEYNDYCSNELQDQRIRSEQQCIEKNGTWTAYSNTVTETGAQDGQCDLYTKCGEEFREASEVYEQKVFIALVVIGVIVLAASFFVKATPVLSSALALTAVLDFVIASIRYWSYSDELLKVAILFVALVALIYLAVKKFTDKV